MKMNYRNPQSGAVSLFIVVFAALLLTIITVGFVQLMLKDQQQATKNDVSQSAYDSALAGVEDAKRVLLLNQSCEANGTASDSQCPAVQAAMTPEAGKDETKCDTIHSALGSGTSEETIIQQSAGDKALDQAYTCVKISVNTPDYLGELSANESAVVPIKATGPYDTVRLSWFTTQDLPLGASNVLNYASPPSTTTLPKQSDWVASRPPIMRSQFIQTGSSFTLADLDGESANGNDVNTAFLYPTTAGLTSLDYATIARKLPNEPKLVGCKANLAAGGYACSVDLQLQKLADGSTTNRIAFLRLTSLYNKTHYSVTLMDGGVPTKFAGVQPQVDSTGRANNLFRRVVSRVELRGKAAVPSAGVTINGDLCKDFSVTDRADDYDASSCTP